MERSTFEAQRTDMPANGRPDNLYAPVADDGGERGRNWSGHTRRSSLYTRAVLNPSAAFAVCAGLAVCAPLGAAGVLRRTGALGRRRLT
jgi:hypothetical protein